MKSIFLMSFILLISISANAQYNENNTTIKLVVQRSNINYKAANTLRTNLSDNLSDLVNIGNYSSFILKSNINQGQSHLIEGMDIKHVGKPIIVFEMVDHITSNKDTMSYTHEVSTVSSSDMQVELINYFVNDKKAQSDFSHFVSAFILAQYNDNCEKHIAKIRSLENDAKYNKALRIAANITTKTNCSPSGKSLQDELLKKQAEKNCKNKLHKIEIMINSGVQFQLRKAIPLLLSISPDAPCATEALEFSKKIGDKIEKSSKIEVDLNNYIKYYDGNSNNWRSSYLESLIN